MLLSIDNVQQNDSSRGFSNAIAAVSKFFNVFLVFLYSFTEHRFHNCDVRQQTWVARNTFVGAVLRVLKSVPENSKTMASFYEQVNTVGVYHCLARTGVYVAVIHGAINIFTYLRFSVLSLVFIFIIHYFSWWRTSSARFFCLPAFNLSDFRYSYEYAFFCVLQ